MQRIQRRYRDVHLCRLFLQMAASAPSKEWRGHVEQTKQHDEAIKAVLPTTFTQLALIGNEVGW